MEKLYTYRGTGNTAMFAEFMHALVDSANQGFVYIGTALSKKAPTARFPNGFGRVVHLVCLAAVLVVAIMSYETVKEGVASVLIGLSMFYVVSRVFMDNVTGAIGESDPEMEARTT